MISKVWRLGVLASLLLIGAGVEAQEKTWGLSPYIGVHNPKLRELNNGSFQAPNPGTGGVRVRAVLPQGQSLLQRILFRLSLQRRAKTEKIQSVFAALRPRGIRHRLPRGFFAVVPERPAQELPPFGGRVVAGDRALDAARRRWRRVVPQGLVIVGRGRRIHHGRKGNAARRRPYLDRLPRHRQPVIAGADRAGRAHGRDVLPQGIGRDTSPPFEFRRLEGADQSHHLLLTRKIEHELHLCRHGVRRVIKNSAVLVVLVLAVLAGGARAEDVSTRMEQGRQLLQQNDIPSALAKFEAVLKLNPNEAEALYYAGTIFLRSNEGERGVQYLERSTQAAPDNARLHFVLGDSYGRLRMVDKAIEQYRAVVGIAPNSPEGREAEKRSRILRGKKYGEQGDLERALQIFSSVLAEYPDDLSVLLDAGLANLLLNRLDNAQSILERVVLLQPDNGLAHSYLADVYDRKGDLQQAAVHYQRVVELLPADAPPARAARLKLALIKGLRQLNEGQAAEAAASFEEVLSLDPRHRLARLNLATAYRMLGDQARSERLLRGLIDDNPADIDARLRLGALLIEEKRWDFAARVLEVVMSRGDVP